jgi:hypothetical protein
MPCASLRIAADMPVLSSPRSWRSFLRPAQRNRRRGRRRSMRCTNGCTGRLLTAADRWRYRLPLPRRPTSLRLRDPSLTRKYLPPISVGSGAGWPVPLPCPPDQGAPPPDFGTPPETGAGKTGAAAGSELRRCNLKAIKASQTRNSGLKHSMRRRPPTRSHDGGSPAVGNPQPSHYAPLRFAAIVITDIDQAGDAAQQGVLVGIQRPIGKNDFPHHFDQPDPLGRR